MMNIEKIRAMTGSYNDLLIGLLKNKKEAALYLQASLEEYQLNGNLEMFLLALRRVTEARGGIAKLSKDTTLNRESLYKTLSSKGNPKLQTISLLLKSLGFQFAIVAI